MPPETHASVPCRVLPHCRQAFHKCGKFVLHVGDKNSREDIPRFAREAFRATIHSNKVDFADRRQACTIRTMDVSTSVSVDSRQIHLSLFTTSRTFPDRNKDMPQLAQHRIDHFDMTETPPPAGVFSSDRTVLSPNVTLPESLVPNVRLKMDGLEFLAALPRQAVPVAFLDPQYRGVLDKLSYGNEGKCRGKRRIALEQMPDDKIARFVSGIDRALMPSGHLFLWVDKFHLCQGIHDWLEGTALEIVDLVTWDKGTIGMGYRTRRRSEYCVVLQKKPRKAKGVWKIHSIPDVILESSKQREHPHAKPVDLQGALLSAVSNESDYVIDPAAGSFSVMKAARSNGRNFLGCDLNG